MNTIVGTNFDYLAVKRVWRVGDLLDDGSPVNGITIPALGGLFVQGFVVLRRATREEYWKHGEMLRDQFMPEATLVYQEFPYYFEISTD